MAVNKYVGEEAIERVASYVNRKLTVVSAIPTSPTELRTILYIGPTTPPPEEYIQGGIYLYDELNDEWILISTADVDLDDYETSWTGTRAEWNALTSTEQAKYEIVNITDDFGPMGDHVIQGYFYNGAFYSDSAHTTLLTPEVGYIYIDLPYDDLYLYDDTESEYILAGGGGADAIVYVNSIPSSNIMNVIYGLITRTGYTGTVADAFLDSSSLFVKTEGSGGAYSYAAEDGTEIEASSDGITYKGFTSLAYDGTSDWTLTFEDSTTATLSDGDTFYFKQILRNYYAGNEDEQSVTPLASGGSGGSSYLPGEGININNDIISVSPASASTLGGVKPDAITTVVNANGVISGNYQGGHGIKINGNSITDKTFIGTQAEWDALTSAQKAEYDMISITDDGAPVDFTPGHAIKDETTSFPQRSNLQFEGVTVADDSTNNITKVTPIPYTAGDKIAITNKEISVADTVKSTFVGTKAEWEALTTIEKAEYDLVNITDDVASGGAIIVDAVADGNMNAVTSNAVYDALAEKNKVITILAEGSDESITSSARYQTTVTNLGNFLFVLVRGYINTNSGGNRFCTVIPVPVALGNLDYNIAIESSSTHDTSLIVNLTTNGQLQIGASLGSGATKVALTFIKGIKA